MHENEWLAERFHAQRTHLQGVAYRMLGSRSEADDAVQEAWLRVSRADAEEIANLAGWFTTIVARVCLDQLRSRKARKEDSLGAHVPAHLAVVESDRDEQERLADSMSVALLVVLETLNPAERVAFVLHDMFDLPFDEIAAIVGRSPAAARQLASRARRRVQGAGQSRDGDRREQRRIVDAFLAASRSGDFAALLALLDPNVELRADRTAVQMGAAEVVRGASDVAKTFAGRARVAQPALIEGAVGLVWAPGGKPRVWFDLTIADGRIRAIQLTADAERLQGLDIEILA